MNYKTATEKLGKRASRKLANNTYLQRDGENVAIVLHGTPVVTFYPNGNVKLYSGGWRTVTTKDRMNYSEYHVFQREGLWYVTGEGKTIPYFDGMILPAAFENPNEKEEEKEKELRRKVRRYCTGFSKWIQKGNLPPLESLPGGDCWDCALREVSTGKPWGEVTHNVEHLLLHMEEGYYVPSLLFHAMEVRRPPLGVSLFWNGMREGKQPYFLSDGMRDLRRYLYSQLGLVR